MSRYEWGCRDGDCVWPFPTRGDAEDHVAGCTYGVLVVSRDGGPWEDVEEDHAND